MGKFKKIINKLKQKRLIDNKHEKIIKEKSSVKSEIVIRLFNEQKKVKTLSEAYKKLIKGTPLTDKETTLIENIIRVNSFGAS